MFKERVLFFNKKTKRRTMEEEGITDDNTLCLQDLKFTIFTDIFLILMTTPKGSSISIL